MATKNGGAAWWAGPSGTDSAILLSVAFVDVLRGWVVGTEDTILATTDGGLTWARERDPADSPATENLSGVAFIDAGTGYAAGSRVLKSSGGSMRRIFVSLIRE